MKKCNACKEELTLDRFWKCNGTSDGLQYHCVSCLKKRRHEKIELDFEKREQYRVKEKNNYDKNIQGWLHSVAKKRAKKLGVEFTISKDDITVVDTCPILGVRLGRYRGRLSHSSYSLDRVNPRYGYIPGNVRVISWKANNAKSNFTAEEIKKLYQYVEGEI